MTAPPNYVTGHYSVETAREAKAAGFKGPFPVRPRTYHDELGAGAMAQLLTDRGAKPGKQTVKILNSVTSFRVYTTPAGNPAVELFAVDGPVADYALVGENWLPRAMEVAEGEA